MTVISRPKDPTVKTFFLKFCALVLAVTLVSCQNAPVSTDGAPDPAVPVGPDGPIAVVDNGQFKPGDQLELFVDEDKSFAGKYAVRDRGYVILPRLGRVNVAGLSQNGAENRIKGILESTQLTSATVMVERITAEQVGLAASGSGAASTEKISVYLTGGVARPGLHRVPLTGNRLPGVYEVIVSAGGLRDFSNAARVTIKRKDASGRLHQIPVRLDQIENGEIPDVPVGNGDIIDVGQKVFGF